MIVGKQSTGRGGDPLAQHVNEMFVQEELCQGIDDELDRHRPQQAQQQQQQQQSRKRVTNSSSEFRRNLATMVVAFVGYMSVAVMREKYIIANDLMMPQIDDIENLENYRKPNEKTGSYRKPKAPTKPHYCTSGNEYLSIKQGGSWIKQSTYMEPPPDDTVPDDFNQNFLCHHRGYKDYYHWSPPCTPLLDFAVVSTRRNFSNGDYDITTTTNNDTSNSTAATVNAISSPLSSDLTMTEDDLPKVLLLGDSLTRQLINECAHRTGGVWGNRFCAWNNVRYRYRSMQNLVLDTIPFESQHAPNCAKEVMENPGQFELDYMTEAKFKQMLHGSDYVFFNQFAHWAKFVLNHITTCYEDQYNLSKHRMMEDVLQFYEDQVTRMAELMREIIDSPNGLNNGTGDKNKIQKHLSAPRFYYRTSPPHAMKWVPRNKPLYKVPPEESRDACTYDQGTYMWRCAHTFNDIGTSAFAASGLSILDTAPVMSLRVDAHPCSILPTDGNQTITKGQQDCLHFCLPSTPADTVLQAIQSEVLAREMEKSKPN